MWWRLQWTLSQELITRNWSELWKTPNASCHAMIDNCIQWIIFHWESEKSELASEMFTCSHSPAQLDLGWFCSWRPLISSLWHYVTARPRAGRPGQRLIFSKQDLDICQTLRCSIRLPLTLSLCSVSVIYLSAPVLLWPACQATRHQSQLAE